MSRNNPEENYEPFHLMLPPSQSLKIGDYQAEFRPIPGKGAAIRDLIDLGLEAYWKKKKKD